jgi:hypothetical protein
MAGKIRTLIESKEYVKAFTKIGDAERLDFALVGLTWAIATNPADFELVPGFQNIRLAKTDPVKDVPRLIIWFSVLSPDEILLRYIEVSKEKSKR